MRTVLKCLIIAVLFSACGKNGQLESDEELRALITAEIDAAVSGNVGLAPLSEIAGFPWSHLLVLSPYSPLDEIGAQLGVELGHLRHFDIGRRDDITLLVFLDGKMPVRAVAYPRSHGDFAEIEPVLIPRRMAIFHLEPMPSGLVRIRLVGM